MKHAKFHLNEYKKAMPAVLDGGMDQIVVQIISLKTIYAQAVAYHKQIQHLHRDEA